jgi:branched-chain amino acid transport system ATP-binding protein
MYFALKDVSVDYDKVRAISDVSVELAERDVVALIGANGAGKTTTLRAITGLAPISSGEIWFEGQRIDGEAPDRLVGRGIAMVPEGRHVFPFMSVRDNLLMGAFLRPDSRAVRADLERTFERFPRLRERYRQAAGTLSGGEQQMVAIGRAPLVVREIARSIRTINREDRVSVILVEQNSRMALRISSHAYALETGRIALSGRSQDLADDEEIRRLYLGG